MDGVLYVLTPDGQRIPAKVNEAGELIVNATAVIGTDVEIRDSSGDVINAVNGALIITPFDENGDPLASDNSLGGNQSLNTKLLGRDGQPLAIEPTDPASYVLPIALKGPLGENVTGPNNDPSNTSVNVKLLSSDNKLLGQLPGINNTPLIIGDEGNNVLVTTRSNNQGDFINALIVTGEVQKETIPYAFTLGSDITSSADNLFLSYVGSFVQALSSLDTPLIRVPEKFLLINKQFNSGTNSGAIDIYFVIEGSDADLYLTGSAIPDEIDFNTNFASIGGILDVISGISPVSTAGVSIYSVDLSTMFTYAGSTIKIYITASEASKEYGQSWQSYLTISKKSLCNSIV